LQNIFYLLDNFSGLRFEKMILEDALKNVK